MSHQFKPGDLALTLIERLGVPSMAVAELLDFYEPGGRPLHGVNGLLYTFSHPHWRCSVSGWECTFVYKPSELMPLRGDFTPEQQKAKEAEPCA